MVPEHEPTNRTPGERFSFWRKIGPLASIKWCEKHQSYLVRSEYIPKKNRHSESVEVCCVCVA